MILKKIEVLESDDGDFITSKDIENMPINMIKTLISFCEREGSLLFIKKHAKSDIIDSYIDNLISKL